MAINISIAPNTATKADIQAAFDAQKAFAPSLVLTDHRVRREKIKRLLDFVTKHQAAIAKAIYQDFKKHPTEVDLTETLVIQSEAKHAMKHLKTWMRPKKVSVPLTMVGTAGRIVYEPKGVSLIIAPWNYPFQLMVGPLISAIAAGNTAILKPSEMTPHTSALIKEMVEELFEPHEVTVFEGNYEISQELLKLPFNHIFFTGSPQVGKIVMTAAAKHLTSVTLELGGKSPAIVDETANVKDAAQKIAWGKLINNGQTCIAPDYVLVQESQSDAFVNEFKASVARMYDGNPADSTSYCRIVNARHYERINDLLKDAVEKGANVLEGGETNADENFIAPTLLTDVNDEMRIMQEEIFGPVLPMKTFRNAEEVAQTINARPKPLAMYINSKSKKNTDYFLKHIRSGDVAINDTMIHFAHNELPFGGANNSGIGKSGGHAGFLAFSHERSVLKQVYGTFKPFYPPYTPKVQKMLDWVKKLV
ncbi:MAG: aldehyde dehydrogenase family protein [Bacteroidota bacterium]